MCSVNCATSGRSLLLLLLLLLLGCAALLAGATPALLSGGEAASDWPPLQHYDIWSREPEQAVATAPESNGLAAPAEWGESAELPDAPIEWIGQSQEDDWPSANAASAGGIGGADGADDADANTERRSKVLKIFPVAVDGECPSDDGRRAGSCYNPYECRAKGGVARGECAHGFGVCCVFVANCNETISNNITYLVSPNFPSFMASNVSACRFRVKLLSDDISQLRIDFQHFSLGQPNRRTGSCDGDAFNVSGGPGGTFTLCGQNSGQHMYYDVSARALSRQALFGSLRPLSYEQIYPNNSAAAGEQLVEISMVFTQRFLPIRLWEIRVAQIPFSQRAPAGCLQYHVGARGLIQTFNFAENGRHLANQRYRICMRQEAQMCSILYEPCDEQSFRIGSSMPGGGMMDGGGSGGQMGGGMPTANPILMMQMSRATTASPPSSVTPSSAATSASSSAAASSAASSTAAASSSSSAAPMTTTAAPTTARTTTAAAVTTTTSTTAAATTTSAAAESSTARASTTAAPTRSTTTTTTTSTTPPSPLSDDVEGSGGDYDYSDYDSPPARPPQRRPRPVRGGFDLLGFLRSAFDLGLRRRRWRWWGGQRSRSGRQFFSTCSDRITTPCIIEDFIGAGLGPLPGCEPVHCGAQFCSSGAWPCRIESTVTPFYIGVNFGSGVGKGSAEDNIGACLRYAQVQCL